MLQIPIKFKEKHILIYFYLIIIFVLSIPIPSIYGQARDYTWANPLLIQFDELLPQLQESIEEVGKITSNVGVPDIAFGVSLNESSQQVMATHVYQILSQQSRLKTVRCGDCSKIRSYIFEGSLRVSRGTQDPEYRKILAQELKVESFLNISVFETEEKLSVSVDVYDIEGKTLFSKVLTGISVKNIYTNIISGELTIPIRPLVQIDEEHSENAKHFVEHKAILVGIERIYRLSPHMYFSGNLSAFSDNTLSSNDPDYPTMSNNLSGGLLEGDFIGGCCQSFFGGVILGVGQIFSKPIHSPPYLKLGLRFSVAGGLNLTLSTLSFRWIVLGHQVAN